MRKYKRKNHETIKSKACKHEKYSCLKISRCIEMIGFRSLAKRRSPDIISMKTRKNRYNLFNIMPIPIKDKRYQIKNIRDYQSNKNLEFIYSYLEKRKFIRFV